VGDGRTLPSHFDPTLLEAFKGCVGRFDRDFARLARKLRTAPPVALAVK